MKKTILSFIALVFAAQMMFAVTPTSPSAIPDYYSGLDGKSGKDLFDAVQTALLKGNPSMNYNGLWTAYAKSDVYPSDSVGKAGKIWDMYGGCTFTYGTSQCGNYSGECECYNREHSIPKSWFGGGTSSPGADLLHIVPTDGKVNGMRSNYAFGEVRNSTYSYNGSKLGTSVTSISTTKKTIAAEAGVSVSASGTVFEPIDQYKGDFARGYMATMIRWADKYQTFTSGDGAKIFSDGYTADKMYGLTAYGVTLLMKWHREDPVSRKEVDRNNGIQDAQGNRNPFIDYPYLAEYIWGEHAGEAINMSKLMPSTDDEFILGVSDGVRGTVSDNPTILDPKGNVEIGAAAPGGSDTKDVKVYGTNLEDGNLTLSISGTDAAFFSLATTTVTKAQASAGYNVTVTYSPTSEGNHTATLTINGCGVTNHTVTLKGVCTAVHTVIWMADGTKFYTTNNVATDAVPALPPTNPSNCNASRVFMGWTANASFSGDTEEIFTSVAPKVSGNTTFYAVYADKASEEGTGDTYSLYSGSIVEGYYVIVYDKKALKAEVKSNRLYYTAVNPSADDKISSPDADIVWYIAKNGDYWTIANGTGSSKKYAASNGTKSQAALSTSINEEGKELWTINGASSNTYEIVNKHNSSKNVNANLRGNGTYGFACYGTTTGGALSLYKAGKATSYSGYSLECTAGAKITVTFDANGGYGKMDAQAIPVSTSRALEANTFTRDGYTFNGWNTKADGKGTAYADKAVVSFAEDVTLYAQWNAIPQYTMTFMNGEKEYKSQTDYAGEAITVLDADPTPCDGYIFAGWSSNQYAKDNTEAPDLDYAGIMFPYDMTYYAVYSKTVSDGGSEAKVISDELTQKTTGITSTTYGKWSGVQLNSDAVYAGNSAGGNSSIQLRSKNGDSGLFTTASGGTPTKVEVVWNSNTGDGKSIDIYGKSTAYAAASELFTDAEQGTLLGSIKKGTSTELEIKTKVDYIGMCSPSGAVYLEKVIITWNTVGGTLVTYYTTERECDTTEDPGTTTAFDETQTVPQARKMLINGQLYILRDNILYNVQGVRVK